MRMVLDGRVYEAHDASDVRAIFRQPVTAASIAAAKRAAQLERFKLYREHGFIVDADGTIVSAAPHRVR